MKVTFFGATQTVTGSRFLVEDGETRILVDCGLFQGLKALRLRNWAPPPFKVASLDAVVLSHAHLDHSGYLPYLYKKGFRGPVYCSEGTRDLLKVLLPDSGYLQEEATKYARRKKHSRHKKPEPLYTEEEAVASLSLLKVRPRGEDFSLPGGMRGHLRLAGHILGASSVDIISSSGSSVTFSGDLGRYDDPIMKPPMDLGTVQTLIMESTYGNRLHPDENPLDVLEAVINRTIKRQGVLLVPAFAVGRAQALLYLIHTLMKAGRIPSTPVYLNSPMAIRATDIFRAHAGEHRLSEAECESAFSNVVYVRTPEESRALNKRKGPMIVVSASGMATGGRILHHLKEWLPFEQNTVLMAGFQAAGTRGESLLSGVDEIKIHGSYWPVRAEIAQIDSLSAHGDYRELLSWIKTAKDTPKAIYLVHGEPSAQDALRRRIKEQIGCFVRIPEFGDSVEV